MAGDGLRMEALSEVAKQITALDLRDFGPTDVGILLEHEGFGHLRSLRISGNDEAKDPDVDGRLHVLAARLDILQGLTHLAVEVRGGDRYEAWPVDALE